MLVFQHSVVKVGDTEFIFEHHPETYRIFTRNTGNLIERQDSSNRKKSVAKQKHKHKISVLTSALFAISRKSSFTSASK